MSDLSIKHQAAFCRLVRAVKVRAAAISERAAAESHCAKLIMYRPGRWHRCYGVTTEVGCFICSGGLYYCKNGCDLGREKPFCSPACNGIYGNF